MFVSPQNSYTEIPTPSVLALESAPFGRWLDHEGRAPMNGISALIRDPRKLPFSYHPGRTQWGVYNPEESPHPTSQVPWSRTSGLKNYEQQIPVVYKAPACGVEL